MILVLLLIASAVTVPWARMKWLIGGASSENNGVFVGENHSQSRGRAYSDQKTSRFVEDSVAFVWSEPSSTNNIDSSEVGGESAALATRRCAIQAASGFRLKSFSCPFS